ncbi:MAG: hypothetical protein J5506_04490, partial [Prevotella sp.]|nr:hypothetical protein [Prevotella sp.]
MKKQILLLFALAMMMAVSQKMMADVTINSTTFPDDNFRNWVLAQSYGSDGVLTNNEIANIKSINVENQSITNLKGIEYFTALESLVCGENQLTALNMSKNIALTYLDCYKNQLTALDVSKNTALKTFYCDENQLTALDVSKNTALTLLMCSDNPLTELDVSKNTLLKRLSCTKNQLNALDVSKNIALTSLGCGDNQLTTLDVSKNSALEILQCWGNQLTTLDVSKNIALTYLGCSGNQLTALDLSKNPALTELYFQHNQLTALNVSSNTALTVVWCYNNQLSTLDLSKNTALKRLYCDSNKLTVLNVSGCTALTSLKCHLNQLTELNVSKNTALTELDCYGNKLASLDISKNIALTNLRCDYNQLTSLDVSKNTALNSLYCYGNQLSALNVSKNTALTILDCSNNQLTALNLSTNTLLTELECYNNLIKESAMDALIASLHEQGGKLYAISNWNEQNVLTKAQVAAAKAKGWICYNNNGEEYEGSDPVAEGIAIDKTNFPDDNFRNWVLKQDYGKDGVLTDDEIASVTKIMVLFSNIENLKGIEYFTALTYLQCAGNQLSSLDVSKNTALEWLYCDENQLTSLDVSHNTALKWFSCSDNLLTSLDVSQNLSLTFLVCFSNRIKEKEMDDLIISLPTVDSGGLYAKDLTDENEQNVISTTQVATAKQKGWTVYAIDGITPNGGEYSGDEPTDLEPINNGETIDFGDEIDENTNLDGNVVGDVYFNINDGSYDASGGCIVVNSPTDNSFINGQDIFGDDFKEGYNGIVFMVPAGKGTVKVEAQTTGTMVLKVKIGDNDPVEMELEGRLKMSFPYNVTEDTYVY